MYICPRTENNTERTFTVHVKITKNRRIDRVRLRVSLWCHVLLKLFFRGNVQFIRRQTGIKPFLGPRWCPCLTVTGRLSLEIANITVTITHKLVITVYYLPWLPCCHPFLQEKLRYFDFKL